MGDFSEMEDKDDEFEEQQGGDLEETEFGEQQGENLQEKEEEVVEGIREVFKQMVAVRFKDALGWDPLDNAVFASCLHAQLVKQRERMLRAARDKDAREVFARWMMECVLEDVQQL